MTGPRQSLGWWAYRYVSGRPLDGVRRTDGGYLRRGTRAAGQGRPSSWAMLPGWRRQAWRLGVPAAGVAGWLAYDTAPTVTTVSAVAATSTAAVKATRHLRQLWRTRRFRAVYIRPTLAALRLACGDAPVRLDVDPSLGSLVARLAKPMSPFEVRTRAWYGEHVEPVVRWLPERAMRAAWWVQGTVSPVTAWVDRELRRPRPENLGPRIQFTASVPYLTPETRHQVKAIVSSKIPAGDLKEVWDLVGERVTAVWTVRRRPPADVGYADLDARFGSLPEWEFFLGLGVGSRPVTISLKDDSPHIALSAGTGAGKSVLAELMAIQVLANGGEVVLLDRKGSHRWAIGMKGVDYCSRPEEMSKALVRLAVLADSRNAEAFHEVDDWDPGHRILLIAEELNATFAQLRAWWDANREPGDPKIPPAVVAFRELLFMGRSAKINVLAVAQMLTANTTGGPESRENFGIRCLARYTKNNWQMLAPEASMPPSSRTLGRWQIVVGGTATETQVCYVRPAEARLFVAEHRPPVHMGGENGAVHVDVPGQAAIKGEPAHVDAPAPAPMLTLSDAIAEGMCPWELSATQKRLQRARRDGRPVPTAVAKRQRADLYERQDLIAWFKSELVS